MLEDEAERTSQKDAEQELDEHGAEASAVQYSWKLLQTQLPPSAQHESRVVAVLQDTVQVGHVFVHVANVIG